jgi:hypothetical protein
MPDRRHLLAAAAVIVMIVVVLLGRPGSPVASVVTTDRLGPESGAAVADYLAEARDSLRGGDSGEHWALVSLLAGITVAAVPGQAVLSGGAAPTPPGQTGVLRISQVIYHVPIDRVDTPVVSVPVPAGDAALLRSEQFAAAALGDAESADDRQARATAVAAERLRAGCACAVALVVRGTLAQLRVLAGRADVRAVQVLPADAGTFAVVPLLPEQVRTTAPQPDDGPVPPH